MNTPSVANPTLKDYESEGRAFESLRDHHSKMQPPYRWLLFFVGIKANQEKPQFALVVTLSSRFPHNDTIQVLVLPKDSCRRSLLGHCDSMLGSVTVGCGSKSSTIGAWSG
jgi:hypothetical protein